MNTLRTWVVFLCVLCILIGWIGRSMIETNKKVELNASMAWGYEEKSQLWNRIRVDENGLVICKKE